MAYDNGTDDGDLRMGDGEIGDLEIGGVETNDVQIRNLWIVRWWKAFPSTIFINISEMGRFGIQIIEVIFK